MMIRKNMASSQTCEPPNVGLVARSRWHQCVQPWALPNVSSTEPYMKVSTVAAISMFFLRIK